MKPDTQRLLLLAAAGGLGYGIYRMHATPSASSSSKTYPPGYYWAYVSQTPEGTRAYNEFHARTKDAVFVRQTVSPGLHTADDYFNSNPNLPTAWILFEAKAPFVWTLPGRPSVAPKGAATQIKDVIGDEEVLPSISSPEHPWNKFWGAFWSDGSDGSSPNPLLSVWSSLGTAGPILVYGATAVVLIKLWTLLPSGSGGGGRRALPPPRRRALPRG